MLVRCLLPALSLLFANTIVAQTKDSLRSKPTKMDEVLVRPDGYYYSDDTADNREVYKKAYRIVNGKTKKLKDKHRQEGQHGLVIDGGITQLANKISGRKKRAQQSIDELEEDQKKRFVETRYTPQLVYLVTNLTGDSLAHFMNAYPMTYYFATNAKELEFKMWVRDNFKDWNAKGRPVPQLNAARPQPAIK